MNKDWQNFEEFLKRVGVYERYIRYQSGSNEFDYDNPYDYVVYPFFWAETEEGHMFWAEINAMWLDELD